VTRYATDPSTRQGGRPTTDKTKSPLWSKHTAVSPKRDSKPRRTDGLTDWLTDWLTD